MPEGMGLGMGGQTPWGRMLGRMNNNFSASMPWQAKPTLGTSMPAPNAGPQPKINPQPLADVSGIQAALGKVAAEKIAARTKKAEDVLAGDLDGLLTSLGDTFALADDAAEHRASDLHEPKCNQTTGQWGNGSPDTAGTRRLSGLYGKAAAGAVKTGFDKIFQTIREKLAAQDNSAPQRSETGGSHGLSFKQNDDDYMQGQAAWAATGKYFRGGSKLKTQPDPFAGRHHGKSAAAHDALRRLVSQLSSSGTRSWRINSLNQHLGTLGNAESAAQFYPKGGEMRNYLAMLVGDMRHAKPRGTIAGAVQGSTTPTQVWQGQPMAPATKSITSTGTMPAIGQLAKRASASLAGSPVSPVPPQTAQIPNPSAQLTATEVNNQSSSFHPGANTMQASKPSSIGTVGSVKVGGSVLLPPKKKDVDAVKKKNKAVVLPDGSGFFTGTVKDAALETAPSWQRWKTLKDHQRDMSSELTMLDKTAEDLTPFAKGFFTRMMQMGCTPEQVKAAVDRVAPKFGKQAADELHAGLEKLGWNPMKMMSAAKPMLGRMGSMFGHAAPAAQKMLPGMEAAAPSMMSRMHGAMTPSLGNTARDLTSLQNVGSTVRDFGRSIFKNHGTQQMLPGMQGAGTAARMAGGAMTGQQMVGDSDSNPFTPWNWGARDWAGAIGGAAYGKRMPQMGALGQAAGRRAFTGGMAGVLGDQAAGMAGMDTNMGRMGALGGFVSPMIPGMKPGQLSPRTQQAAGAVDNLVNKPWQNASPAGTAKQIFGRSTPLTQRVGAAAGPGMMYGMAGLGGVGAGMAGFDAAKQGVGNFIQSNAAQGIASKMQDPAFQDQMAQQMTGMSAQDLKAKVSQLKQMGDMGGLSQLGSMFDPVIDMFMGQGAGAAMNPIQKLMIVLGGGTALLGGMAGSGGMAGLGGLALAGGLMGGFPGLGGRQSAQTAQGAPAASQGPPAGSPGLNMPQAVGTGGMERSFSPPQGEMGGMDRNELEVQRANQMAPG